MIFGTGDSARQMFWGNILLVGCCIFYLLWWVLAFKPTGAVKGLRSSWLLIPALFLGCAAVLLIIRGANGVDKSGSFFSDGTVLIAAAVFYIILLIVTQLAFHRQVTTELFLIVGWTALAFLESNALYSLGIVARNGALMLLTAAVITAVLSMICYVLYYGFDDWAGYVDGMIPLLLAGAYMTILAVLCSGK